MENQDEGSTSKKKSSTEMGKGESSQTNQKDINTILHHLHIAHELAINEDLNSNLDLTKHDHENILRNALKESYWNLFREQISENPPKLELAFELLEEIKNSLDFVMTPNIKKLRDDVNQMLDMDALRKQAELGAIDVMYYAQYILRIISKICAPIRDKYVAELCNKTDIVAIFRGILEVLSLMKYDLLNFSLKMIKPDIMANNLAYEREKFKEYIVAIGGNLPVTDRWLSNHKNESLSSKQIVCDAFIDLLTWDNDQPQPETLFLESKRLHKLKLEYFRVTTYSTLYFLAVGLIPSQLLHDDDLKESIKSLIIMVINEAQSADNINDLTKNIAQDLMCKIHKREETSAKNKEDLAAELKIFQKTLEQALLADNKVKEVISTRVNNYLKQSLLIRDPLDEHLPPSLNLFKKELHTLKFSFQRIFAHNLLVCKEYYDHLLNNY